MESPESRLVQCVRVLCRSGSGAVAVSVSAVRVSVSPMAVSVVAATLAALVVVVARHRLTLIRTLHTPTEHTSSSARAGSVQRCVAASDHDSKPRALSR
jgi:hypothetical protein